MDRAVGWLLRPHPLGVYPLGNALFDARAGQCRASGLGRLMSLGDELLLSLLRVLTPWTCARLSCASAVLHAFCGHEELWREHCLHLVVSGGSVSWAEEGTWRAAFVRSYGPPCARRPAAVRLTDVKVYSDVLYQGFRCATTELDPRWLARETLERIDVRRLSTQDFVQRFEERSRPVVLEGCTEGWPASQLWSQTSLVERFGDVRFACGPCELPLREFYAYAERNYDDAPLFVFDKFFSERAPALLEEYEVPDVFRGRDLFDLLGHARPDFRWLLIGHRRSGSKWHIDPNKTCAWNAVVRGRKRWLLLPPGCPPPGVHPSHDGAEVVQPLSLIEWFLNFYDELRRIAERNPSWDLLEGTCRPGDAVFVPCGWWHCVLNLDDDTIAVTQNYASETHVHSIRRFLSEKRSSVSGTRDRSFLGGRFDEVLARARPDLLAASIASRTDPKAHSSASGSFSCNVHAFKNLPQAFSFWDHLRSTGSSLMFGASAAETLTAPATTVGAVAGEEEKQQNEVDAEGEERRCGSGEQDAALKRRRVWADRM